MSIASVLISLTQAGPGQVQVRRAVEGAEVHLVTELELELESVLVYQPICALQVTDSYCFVNTFFYQASQNRRVTENVHPFLLNMRGGGGR